MESLLRDLDREQSKMQADMEKFRRHYQNMAEYVREYIEKTTIEWAKLIVDHQKTMLLIMETTQIVDEHGRIQGNEPLRITTLSNGEIWDQLLHPTYSHKVTGEEYHGITMDMVKDCPPIQGIWSEFTDMIVPFAGRHIVIFGADWTRNALQSVMYNHLLDDAYCLHNKCREYYGEFYDLSLETILSYQGIDKKREDLKDSRDRIQMLERVILNLSNGIKKPEPQPETTDDLDDHPF